MIKLLKQLSKHFCDAWNRRDRLGDGTGQHQALEFLPAALEILERPPSPVGRLLGWSLMGLFAIAVVWAMVGQADIVAVAEGKIIPGGRVKQIQPLEKGVVKTIFVKEGQTVSAGEPVIELDRALTQADQQRLRNELRFIQLRLARLQGFAELLNSADSESVTSPQQLALVWPKGLLPARQSAQQNLLWHQWRDYRSQLDTLSSERHIRQAEHRASLALVTKLEATLPLISKRTSAVKSLLNKGLAPETQYLELEQQRIGTQQNLVAEQARTQQLAASISSVDHQVTALEAETLRQTLATIEDLERQNHSLSQELAKVQDLNAKQILYAPVDGKVQQLAIHTEGGVVTEAQTLMWIVPKEDYLEVEATLANKDIGFVKVGQLAEIKVHTFPFIKYGVVEAQVMDITADAVDDEQQGLVYKLRLKMKESQMQVDRRLVDLIPGMLVSAEVKTGKRRLIEFVMAPLLRYKDESIRER